MSTWQKILTAILCIPVALVSIIMLIGIATMSSSEETQTAITRIEAKTDEQTEQEIERAAEETINAEPDTQSETIVQPESEAEPVILQEPEPQEKQEEQKETAPSTDATESSVSEPEQIEYQSEPPEENKIVDDDNAMLLYLTALHMTMQENYGNNYMVDYADDVVLVQFWQEGISTSAVMLDSAGIDYGWNSLKAGIQSMATDFYHGFSDAGMKNKHIMVSLMNDLNTDKAILTFFDGLCIYDAMEDEQ